MLYSVDGVAFSIRHYLGGQELSILLDNQITLDGNIVPLLCGTEFVT